MRRILSILLAVICLLPLLTPVLSAQVDADAQLPACCRRRGVHHCIMNAGAMKASAEGAVAQAAGDAGERRVSAPVEQCPYCPHSLGVAHHDNAAPGESSEMLAGLIVEPSAVAQAECLRRISFDRSRQKRGPPAVI